MNENLAALVLLEKFLIIIIFIVIIPTVRVNMKRFLFSSYKPKMLYACNSVMHVILAREASTYGDRGAFQMEN